MGEHTKEQNAIKEIIDFVSKDLEYRQEQQEKVGSLNVYMEEKAKADQDDYLLHFLWRKHSEYAKKESKKSK